MSTTTEILAVKSALDKIGSDVAQVKTSVYNVLFIGSVVGLY